ncbi:hypothetical protein D3C73_1427260 [compost metagenome]
MLAVTHQINADDILQAEQFSDDRGAVGPVAALCPDKTVASRFNRQLTLPFAEGSCEMIFLTDKIALIINLMLGFFRPDAYVFNSH